MKLALQLFFLFLLLILVSGCGKKSSQSGKKYTRITQAQMRDLLDNQVKSCALQKKEELISFKSALMKEQVAEKIILQQRKRDT